MVNIAVTDTPGDHIANSEIPVENLAMVVSRQARTIAAFSILSIFFACSSPVIFYSRGVEAQAKGDLEAALAYYTKAIDHDAAHSRAYNNRALVKQKTGDLEGALSDFAKAIEVDPGFEAACFNRAALRQMTGEYEEAMNDYSRAVELNPASFEAFNNRGNLRAELDDPAGAITDFTKAIEIRPDFASAYYNRALVRAETGDFVRAIADFETAARINPGLKGKVTQQIARCRSKGIPFIPERGLEQGLPESRPEDEEKILADILTSTAAYCEKVKSIALFFTCLETMESRKFRYRKRVATSRIPSSSSYLWTTKYELKGIRSLKRVYDYQLIRKAGELEEKRLLLEENGRKKRQENARIETPGYSSRYLIYGPVGFLSRYWQSHFDYEFAGRERLASAEAVIVRASPRSATQENNSAGRIWVDSRDFSILKIEWEPRFSIGEDGGRLPASSENYKKTVKWQVEYDIESNGIRFPSRQFIQESLVDTTGSNRLVLQEIVTRYGPYKFFTVSVEKGPAPRSD